MGGIGVNALTVAAPCLRTERALGTGGLVEPRGHVVRQREALAEFVATAGGDGSIAVAQ